MKGFEYNVTCDGKEGHLLPKWTVSPYEAGKAKDNLEPELRPYGHKNFRVVCRPMTRLI